jgi:hypothetical protein
MRADDAVVYLNGKEVYRVNLPAGAVNTDPRQRESLPDWNESFSFRSRSKFT